MIVYTNANSPILKVKGFPLKYNPGGPISIEIPDDCSAIINMRISVDCPVYMVYKILSLTEFHIEVCVRSYSTYCCYCSFDYIDSIKIIPSVFEIGSL